MLEIGKRLLERRRECNLNQPELAEKIGYRVSYIDKVENGEEPTLEFLKRIGEVFNVLPNYFLASDEEVDNVKEISRIVVQWGQLSEEGKKSVADFLKSTLEEKYKRDEEGIP